MSKLMSSQTALITADVFNVLKISAEKRKISEMALFSADYLWNFNPGINFVSYSLKKFRRYS